MLSFTLGNVIVKYMYIIYVLINIHAHIMSHVAVIHVTAFIRIAGEQ